MKKAALIQAVHDYREKSFKKWLIWSGGALACMTSVAGFITIGEIRKYMHHHKEYTQLTRSITALQTQWGAHQKYARSHKHLKKEQLFFSKQQIAPLLEIISQAMPQHTYLTKIAWTPESCTLQGFAHDEEELRHLISSITEHPSEKGIHHTSCDEPAGLYFTISIDLSNQDTYSRHSFGRASQLLK